VHFSGGESMLCRDLSTRPGAAELSGAEIAADGQVLDL